MFAIQALSYDIREDAFRATEIHAADYQQAQRYEP
jgi:hypothetical protein